MEQEGAATRRPKKNPFGNEGMIQCERWSGDLSEPIYCMEKVNEMTNEYDAYRRF
jgi:hypothetical protein